MHGQQNIKKNILFHKSSSHQYEYTKQSFKILQDCYVTYYHHT